MTSNNPDADRLLSSARAILDRTIAMPPHQASRAASFLARRALETIVLDLCARAGIRSNIATMRARLIVLRHRADVATAEILESAWLGLSRACHHHAFELAPAETEIRALIERVESARPRKSP